MSYKMHILVCGGPVAVRQPVKISSADWKIV